MIETKQPIIFGEVLFDCFSENEKVLGGAPFNVAWNLKGLGLNPFMLSRVGSDADGGQVLNAMQKWGLDTRGIQLDAKYPTGRVEIEAQGSSHKFIIKDSQAYDYIIPDHGLLELSSNTYGMLYHGSLATRSETSRTSLSKMIEATELPVFIDLNLREPWYDKTGVESLLSGATWLKLNDEELMYITDSKNISTRNEFVSLAGEVVSKFSLDLIIVTLANKGSFLLTSSQKEFHADPTPDQDIVDTVGAGDAFSAVSILGLLCKWDYETLLIRADEFASSIVEIRGATSFDFELYRKHLSNWGML